MRKLLVALLFSTAVLAGCGSNAPTSTPAQPATSGSAGATAAGDATSAPPKADELTKQFGSTFKWDNGIEYTLGAPQPFTPSEFVTQMIQNKDLTEYVVMEATLVNGTKEPIPAMAAVHETGTTGDVSAEQIFDSDQNVGLPSGDVMPGATLKWKIAWARLPGQPFVVAVSNMSDFTSKKGYYKE